jgi:PAS domain S-box-containing protein
VLLSTGWQDICTRFHRVHPEAAHNCAASDLALTQSVRPGEHVAYHCRNGLWDVVTPLMIGGKHVGNIFTGQFFYEEDTIDEAAFAAQAARFGFDQESYLAALRRVPRVSREWVAALMVFLTKFAELISKSSFRNLKLARALVQQRRIEDDLRGSEERFRQLVETSSDLIWETDAAGRYIYVSPKIKDLLGFAPEELIGRLPLDFMPPEEAQRLNAILREFTMERRPFSHLENINLHKNGSLVHLETSGAPELGDHREFLGYRGVDRNVTERRRLEAQFRQAQKLEGIGQLAGGIAHDFNNILAGIMMYLDLLQMKSELPGEAKQALRDLGGEVRRAASLTRQLLMFSRRSVLAVKPLDLNDVVANLLKMLSRLIGEHIELRFHGKPALPSVGADAGMLEQVLMNLVVNARDAMPKGGHITISTSPVVQGEAEVALNPVRCAGDFVCLSVSDTGCGMDEATLKRIFEPFFTTKEAGKGTGLGLATVHGIIA